MKMIDWNRMEQAARQAARQACCPYSNYRVGAALLAEDGTVITGCNIENASYAATLCAERVTLAKAISEGRRGFAALVIAAGEEEPAPPCGICRQMLAEFCAHDLPIRCITLKATRPQPVMFTLGELLPHAFSLNPEK